MRIRRTVGASLVLVSVVLAGALLIWGSPKAETPPAGVVVDRAIPINENLTLVLDGPSAGGMTGHLMAKVDGQWVTILLRNPAAGGPIPAR